MEYRRTEDGFEELPQRNVDFGGGLERLAMAVVDSPDVFRIDLLQPLIDHVEQLAGVRYEDQPGPAAHHRRSRTGARVPRRRRRRAVEHRPRAT